MTFDAIRHLAQLVELDGGMPFGCFYEKAPTLWAHIIGHLLTLYHGNMPLLSLSTPLKGGNMPWDIAKYKLRANK